MQGFEAPVPRDTFHLRWNGSCVVHKLGVDAMGLQPLSEPSLEDVELDNWQYGDSDQLLTRAGERIGVWDNKARIMLRHLRQRVWNTVAEAGRKGLSSPRVRVGSRSPSPNSSTLDIARDSNGKQRVDHSANDEGDQPPEWY